MNNFDKKYAIIIGVSEYHPSEDIKPLEFASSDAIRIYNTLLKHSSFDSNQVKILVNGGDSSSVEDTQSPTRANILNAISFAASQASDNDLIFIYFAGHGVEISQTPYLIAADTRRNVIAETAIDVSILNKTLQRSKARCQLRIFDACRSSFTLGRSFASMSATLEAALLQPIEGWATFSSCKSGEQSWESNEFGQGVFSYYLCEGMSGKAVNKDGVITFDSLVEYVRISVSNWCDRHTRIQTPHLKSDLAGTVVFGEVPTIVQKTPLNNLKHPFAALGTGLQSYLADLPSDSRDLTFTSEEEAAKVDTMVFTRLKDLIERFESPDLEVTIDGPKQLSDLGHTFFNPFNQLMREMSIFEEFKGRAYTSIVSLKSNQASIPSSQLLVTVGQFSFFYLLRYSYKCISPLMHSTFKPKKSSVSGYFYLQAFSGNH